MQKSKQFSITSFPRIHISLIGMNDDGYRVNGSIGFSISAPTINSQFEKSGGVEIIDKREKQFTSQELEKLRKVLTEAKNSLNFKTGIKCIIDGGAIPHYGLGSNTSIYMSCFEALFVINETKYDHEDIITHCKRGGTSGIGINTYFEGGFVFDVGIKNEEQALHPSSIAERKGRKPLLIHKCRLPKWKIGLCIPKYILNKTEQEEIEFFKSNCPIDKCSVENILYESVYGVTSSILENDYNTFCQSINAIQLTKWKKLERSLYGDELIELEKQIKELGADCVGMSSLGPLLFFMGNVDNIINVLSNANNDIQFYVGTFNNQGRIVNYD